MSTGFTAPDLQSFPLTMIVGNILDSLTPDVIKRISSNILNHLCQPIIITDHEGKVAFINTAFAKMTCLSLCDNISNDFVFQELNLMDQNLNKILDFGIPVNDFRDNLIVRGNTKKVPVKINIFPIFGSSQLRLGSVCTIVDITTDVNYHELLQKSETILDAINIGVITLDHDLIITLVNKHAECSFNITKSIYMGKSFLHLVDHLAGDWSYIIKCLKKNIEIKDYEFITNTEKKEYFIIDTHLLKNDYSETYGTIIVFKNITHIKQIELQLARSEKLKAIGELAAGTAHEIRNPLTTVRGFVQILSSKMSEMGIHQFDSHVQLVLSEIDRVNKIISNFLNLAKPQKKKVDLFNLKDLLNDVMFLLENEALRKEISINLIIDEAIPPINGDKDELEQVFLNIINNAFQAMPAHSCFTIKAFMSNDRCSVIIDFIDTGEGIPEDLLSKIFDPFFSTKNEGTGLGLAISNRIINDHHGELRVNSKVGEGTTFTIILPCTQN